MRVDPHRAMEIGKSRFTTIIDTAQEDKSIAIRDAIHDAYMKVGATPSDFFSAVMMYQLSIIVALDGMEQVEERKMVIDGIRTGMTWAMSQPVKAMEIVVDQLELKEN